MKFAISFYLFIFSAWQWYRLLSGGDLSVYSASGAKSLLPSWHGNSAVHGLISALKDCRAAVIMRACLPVIGLINRLRDDPCLSKPVTAEEGEKNKRENKSGEGRSEVV